MADELILVTRIMPQAGIDYLKEKGYSLIQYSKEEPPPKEWVMENIPGVSAIFCSLNEKIDKEVIDAACELKVISQLAVGYDNIDVEYANSKKIPIAYTPDVLSPAVADLTWSILLAASRRVVEADNYVRTGKWDIGFMPVMLPGRNVYGKTLGILGMGRIGIEIAKRSIGFDMDILYHNRRELKDNPVNARYVDFDTLLTESDYLVVVVPLTHDTQHMIGESEFEKMKDSSYLINVSRGQVVDQKALYQALINEKITGAALDVLEKEPIKKDDPLLTLDNIVFTPHIGSDTFETRANMSLMCAKAIHKILSSNELPENTLNKEALK